MTKEKLAEIVQRALWHCEDTGYVKGIEVQQENSTDEFRIRVGGQEFAVTFAEVAR